MDLMHEFQSASKEFSEFRQMLEDTKSQPLDDDMRSYLDEITQALDEQFAEVQRTFPEAVQEINRIQEEAKATNDQAIKQLDGLKQRMAEMEKAEAEAATGAAAAAAAAGPSKPPPVKIDPLVGGKLRDELLALYGLKTAAPAQPADPGSIWRMFPEESKWEPESSKPPELPAQTEPPTSKPPPPKKPHGDDL